ncbi:MULTISPECIES: transporter substrate-binding domain-containing protein [unclassified Oceanispirochaeta]|uniref:transporter substrate-binding domain-containing protein n=1 Tax=unclassified Oceanispirochaeta TaxID=2635722 RepID=UPI0013141FC4|nr:MULTISPECIES: transporter substrate-binding domain-containing protein [unclassified Oceanispirochaeta]MBF9014000.1 transporter substrate-binding domain-containing protein [Oceanispirochaeta sp. M2]NPD70491.1 transporter substrate-binding domain-containing protein [Oceanispirochaeta sp. M1]
MCIKKIQNILILTTLVLLSVMAHGQSSTGQNLSNLPDLPLTVEEQNWIQNHSVIRIGVDSSYAPYSFREEDGSYHGIAMEFTEYLSQWLGITMEVIPDLSWTEILTAVQDRELDVVLTMSHRPEREEFVNFTEIYLPTPLVIMEQKGVTRIRNESDIDGLTVALVEEYSSTARVLEEHPAVNPLLCGRKNRYHQPCCSLSLWNRA